MQGEEVQIDGTNIVYTHSDGAVHNTKLTSLTARTGHTTGTLLLFSLIECTRYQLCTSQLHLAVCMCRKICRLFLHLNRQFHFTRNAQCSDSLVETGCCSGHVIQLQVAQGCLVAERLEKAVADAGEEGVGTDFVLIDTAKTVASELNELLTLAQEEEAERLRKEEVARLKVQFPPDLMIADMVMCARPRRRKRRRSDR